MLKMNFKLFGFSRTGENNIVYIPGATNLLSPDDINSVGEALFKNCGLFVSTFECTSQSLHAALNLARKYRGKWMFSGKCSNFTCLSCFKNSAHTGQRGTALPQANGKQSHLSIVRHTMRERNGSSSHDQVACEHTGRL